MHFDPTISVGNLVTILLFWIPGIWWAASINQKVNDILEKMDSFITRAEVLSMKAGAEGEHESIRREIDWLRGGRKDGT